MPIEAPLLDDSERQLLQYLDSQCISPDATSAINAPTICAHLQLTEERLTQIANSLRAYGVADGRQVDQGAFTRMWVTPAGRQLIRQSHAAALRLHNDLPSLVAQLQHDSTDHKIPVAALLLKTLPVVRRCDDKRFAEWVQRESNGYKESDTAADYRNLKGQYVVLTNDGRTLPIRWNDASAMNSRFITGPVSELESLLAGDGNTFAVKVNVDTRSLTLDLEPDDSIAFSLTRATLAGFLSAVRQRILQWTIEQSVKASSTDVPDRIDATGRSSEDAVEVQPETRQEMDWDIFISHASEDKDDVARPLADKFIERGLRVWYDEYTLTVGDSLRRSIDRGLAGSRFGLVILSPHFFEKEWPQKELDGLVAREDGSEKRILPVWHEVSQKDVVAFSPLLADRLGVPTAKGLDHVVREIMLVFQTKTGTPPSPTLVKKRPTPKRQKSASSKSTGKSEPAVTWVMIDRFFFPARNVQHTQDGTFQLGIVPANGDQEADLESLHPQQYGGSSVVPFSVRNDAHLVRIKGCEKDFVGRTAKWTLTLTPDDGNFGRNGVEATIVDGGKSYTPDDLAQLRAGRLLLNDPPIQKRDQSNIHHLLLEAAINGSGKYRATTSVIRTVYDSYGKRSYWRELARLAAVFLLKATGTVDHVIALDIGPVRSGRVAVSFRGRRRPQYSGQEPVPIEVSGDCVLR